MVSIQKDNFIEIKNRNKKKKGKSESVNKGRKYQTSREESKNITSELTKSKKKNKVSRKNKSQRNHQEKRISRKGTMAILSKKKNKMDVVFENEKLKVNNSSKFISNNKESNGILVCIVFLSLLILITIAFNYC